MTEAESQLRIEALEEELKELQQHIRHIGKEWARESGRAESALVALRALRTWRDEH